MSDAVAQVRSAIDIVELVSQTVALKRAGKGFIGLCPFHSEKTPSFHVNPGRQTFHCFGCKASGSVFDFVMKRDRIEFREALELLAGQAGVALPKQRSDGPKGPERQVLLEAHSAACMFFENLLASPQGVAAREYLAKRGFTPALLKQFRVGLAPPGWDGLVSGPVGRRFNQGILVTAGLAKPRNNGEGSYDTFRNRIMFPIRNESGQIIAFGGRVMPGGDDPAKYLNSPETPLFSKSRCAFGLDLARQRIIESRTVAVVEGYTDVMMAHQFGVSNVVSALGTALTEQHLKTLKRFADRVVLIFDGDAAGDLAVDRILQLFLSQEVELAVATLPQGKDPDEYLLETGAAGFESLIAGATDALEHAWRQTSRKFQENDGDLTGQQRAAREYLELLTTARDGGAIDPIRWGAALARVAKMTGIPIEELHRKFGRIRKPGPKAPTPPPEATEPVAQVEDGPLADEKGSADVTAARARAESEILGILLIEPQRWEDVQEHLRSRDFADPTLRKLAERFWVHQRDEGASVLVEFLDRLSEESLKSLAIELAEKADQLENREQTLDNDMRYLAEERAKQESDATLARLHSAAKIDEEEQIRLLKQLMGQQPNLRRVGG